ncbi:MAG: hypothetical protein GF383_14520 [Candidatus Lokiarchaeota archaeon]|nr:hypothetical protein [Candidatus Lokiarchaeota archaeon]MBD3342632.1 hypothetical protein [Candidatus Lokiarchaeota archaeon]
MKESEYKEERKKLNLNNLHLGYSNYLENSIKNLNSPGFLGSIHLKEGSSIQNNRNIIESMTKRELEAKVDKAVKSTMLNPITKVLILLMIAFNLFWIVYFYLP